MYGFIYMANFFVTFWQELLRQLSPVGKNISEEITHLLNYEPRFYINIGNLQIGITDAMLSLFISMVVLIILVLVFVTHLNIRPKNKQSLVEVIIESVNSICNQAGLNEQQTNAILPFVTTVGFLIIISNVLSLFKIKPAAQNPAFPIFLALLAMVYIIFMTIRFIGFKGFFQAMLYPKAGLLPFKVLDLLIKPISLSFRLFGNIFGAFILMEFVALIVPLIIPGILGLWFDIGDGIVQGSVFAYLVIVYIGEFVENAHHYHESLEEKRIQKAKANRANLVRKEEHSLPSA